MDVIAGISAATEGLKLVNELRSIDREWDKAELKIRLIDVVDRLVDAKQALVDAQERESDLRNLVADLQIKLRQRARLIDENGLLFEMSDAGEKLGQPYCNHCYVKEEKLFRFRHREAGPGSPAMHYCDHCHVAIKCGPPLPRQEPNRGRDSWLR